MSITKEEEQVRDPMTTFMYALKASESRRQYPRRFKMFLDYLKLEGALEKQARQFLSKSRTDPQWAEENFMRFIGFQIERVKRGDIAESTNYLRTRFTRRCFESFEKVRNS